MVATVNVEIWKGGADTAPGTETNVDSLGPPNIRFHTADTPDAIDTTNPVPIPSSSFNYSYWVHVALQFGGTFTQLSNFRHYSDGTIGWTLGTNGELRRGNRDSGDDGCPKASYNLATGTIGTTGDSIEDVQTVMRISMLRRQRLLISRMTHLVHQRRLIHLYIHLQGIRRPLSYKSKLLQMR